jgi:hypothetical protein
VYGSHVIRWDVMKLGDFMRAAILLFILAWLSQAAQAVSQVGGIGDFPWLSQAEHLTLTGGMVIVIVILWKAFQSKDTALVESTKVTVAALQATSSSNAELRKTIQESVDSKRDLRESIELLTASINRLPCTAAREGR